MSRMGSVPAATLTASGVDHDVVSANAGWERGAKKRSSVARGAEEVARW